MSQGSMSRSLIPNFEAERAAWINEVEQLAADVERWSAVRQWFVKRETKELVEDEIGAYQLPVLTIQASRGRAYFNPVARYILGGSGRIDLYAAPSFAQAVLLKSGGEWRFMSEDLIDLNKPWSEQSFEEIISDLLSRP